jgi:uncharacterized protein YjdB
MSAPDRPRSVPARLFFGGFVALVALASCTDFGEVARPDPGVASVVVTAPAGAEVEEDGTVQFQAEARDAAGARIAAAPLVWLSSDPNLASISPQGLATGHLPGTVQIRAQSGTVVSAPVELRVRARVVSVVVSGPASREVEVGNQVVFTAEVRDARDDTIPQAVLAWSSSDSLVARIDAGGRAVGIAVGSAQIRAASGGVVSAAVTLVVVPATQVPASIAIVAPVPPVQVPVFETVQFAAEVRDTHGQVIPDAAVDWLSSNDTAAGIDPTGLATGLAEGTTQIRATSGALQSPPVDLEVLPAVVAVVVVTPNGAVIEVGGTTRFTAEARAAGGQTIPAATYAWSSSDETVARVDSTGLAAGLAVGTCTIRAASGPVTSAPVTLQVQAAGPDFATEVQPIFTRSCAVGGCHAGPFPAEGMSLEAGKAYAAIVNRPSISGVPIDLVEPGQPQNSMLYHKIALCDATCISGERMPPPPRQHLSGAEIGVIQEWIAAGANP